MTPPAETRLLLLRHAETSAPLLFHGAESDVGLGDESHRQAARAAAFLAAYRPAAVYSSAMRRARETALPIALACGHVAPISVPELHERRMGPLSGVPIETHRHLSVADRLRWQAGDLDAAHEGTESYNQIRERVLGPITKLTAAHPDQTIVVVAHGMVIRVLLTTLLDGYGLDQFDRIPIRHVAVNDLRFDPSSASWRAEGLDLESPSRALNPPDT